MVKKYAGSRLHVYPGEEDIPIQGIVGGPWLETVLELGQGTVFVTSDGA